MSTQRDILFRRVGELSAQYPGCGVLVSGSVQRGEERPDSDIDLFVVLAGEGQFGMTHEMSREGVKIDLALFPETILHNEVEKEWHKFWMFSRAEVVHDPTGIARRNQAIVQARFRDHPEIDQAWERQFTEVRRHKSDRSYQLQFWTWDDFSRHIAGMVAEQEEYGGHPKPGD